MTSNIRKPTRRRLFLFNVATVIFSFRINPNDTTVGAESQQERVVMGGRVSVGLNLNGRPTESFFSRRKRFNVPKSEVVTMTSSTAVVPGTSLATSSALSSSSPPPSSDANRNFFQGIAEQINDFCSGVGQLYTNYQTCSAIRSKQKQNTGAGISGPPISFDEYDFLLKGREDRGKVLNLGFMAFFSPNFLPYAFLFFPNMLPGPLKGKVQPPSSHKGALVSRAQAHAVLSTLMRVEEDAFRGAPRSMIPFGFGKQAAARKRERARVLHSVARSMLRDYDALDDGRVVLQTFEERIASYDNVTFDRAATRLADLPPPVVKGMAGAIAALEADGTAGAGPLGGLTPGFLTRNKVLAHLTKVNEADTFLVDHGVDLDTVSGSLLVDTCRQRFIGTPSSTEEELRTGLSNWLALTAGPSKWDENDEEIADTSNNRIADGAPTKLLKDYNKNFAKFTLMCYNVVGGVRDTGCASCLPKLLYNSQ